MQGDMKISGIIEAARATAENASLKPLDPNADLREAAENGKDGSPENRNP